VPISRVAGGLKFVVAANSVRAGVNEVTLELPPGSQLRKLDFNPTTQWWK
jgi:hypothetical protein